MEHPYENLDDEQKKILDALVTYSTKEQAAKALGISRATLYRRLQDVELKEAVRQARTEALSEATAHLQHLALRAAMMLAVVMSSEDAPYSARVAAASKILDTAYRTYELEEIAGEIEELKGRLQEVAA